MRIEESRPVSSSKNNKEKTFKSKAVTELFSMGNLSKFYKGKLPIKDAEKTKEEEDFISRYL